ncbi:hypothetical protein [Streptomyces sp. M10]|uniref:hypothetical protein n=1 Tax=Streptomyces sp. M10 TaxID=412968 RepID=UPI00064789FE|nr:hypothetical protein [Streptomyces sp. M10]
MDTSDPSRPGAEATPAEPPTEAPAEAVEAPAEAQAETPSPRRRPRGLTTLIVACAALVGVVGGTATGYAIQAERKPTPLPALSQADLAYPKKALPESERPAPLTAKHDTAVKADGDLRKLLVGKPKGFREATGYFVNGVSPEDGWLSPGGRSLEYTEPGEVLVDSVRNGIRRVAAANWQRGEYEYVAVRLVQFRPGAVAEAQAGVESSRWDAANRTRSGHEEGREVKAGSGAGFFVYEPDSKPGYLTVYGGRAVGYRGDVMFDLHFSDTKPLSEKAIKDLALKQLERL